MQVTDISAISDKFSNFFTKETLIELLVNAGIFLLIIGVGILLIWLIVRLIKRAMARGKVDPSLISFVAKAVWFIGLIIILIAALSQLGVSTTGLVASFSAMLAAVALALKDSLSDIASGIIILFTRPFVTGDFIEFGSYKGTVQKIDITNTNILTYDDTNVIIPNRQLTTSEINNYTAHSLIRVFIKIPLPYGCDSDKARNVLLETANRCPVIARDQEHIPAVFIENYNESSVEFSVKVWCEFGEYWNTYHYLMENIKKDLEKNGIEIPFNQLDVHVIEKK